MKVASVFWQLKQCYYEHWGACIFSNWCFCFFRYMPTIGISGSYGSFSFLRKLHSIFFSGCTNLHFYWLCTSIPFSVHPHQHLLFMCFLMIAILTCLSLWIMILICIFSVISGIKHLFICLLDICISSLEKCLLSSSANFLTGLLDFLMWSCMTSLCNLYINYLLVISLTNIFFRLSWLLLFFALSMVYFACKSF